MTVKELFDFIKGVRPGFAFNDAQMMVWLNEIEGKVQTDIMLLDPAVGEDGTVTGLVEYDVTTDMDTELIVPFPWNKLYRYFMLMSIDLYNGEFQRYGNSFAQFNEAYEEYAAWYAQNIAPANGLAVAHGYYLTAYQFAVKGGFTGTVDELSYALSHIGGSVLDTTLTHPGEAAESKAVGDALAYKFDEDDLDTQLAFAGRPADGKAVGDAIANIGGDDGLRGLVLDEDITTPYFTENNGMLVAAIDDDSYLVTGTKNKAALLPFAEGEYHIGNVDIVIDQNTITVNGTTGDSALLFSLRDGVAKTRAELAQETYTLPDGDWYFTCGMMAGYSAPASIVIELGTSTLTLNSGTPQLYNSQTWHGLYISMPANTEWHRGSVFCIMQDNAVEYDTQKQISKKVEVIEDSGILNFEPEEYIVSHGTVALKKRTLLPNIIEEKKMFIRYSTRTVLSTFAKEVVDIYVPMKTGYVDYIFAHTITDTPLSEGGGNVWRLAQVSKVNDSFEREYQITTLGETEMALTVPYWDTEAQGGPKYVRVYLGGVTHGNEWLNDGSTTAILDGVKVDIRSITMPTAFTCFEFFSTSTLYYPIDHETVMGEHSVMWSFTKDGLELRQHVTFAGDYDLAGSYMTMLCAVRDHYGTYGNPSYEEYQITDTYVDDADCNPYDVSEPGFTTYPFQFKTDRKLVKLLGDEKEVGMTVEFVDQTQGLAGEGVYLYNGASYNKVYNTICGYDWRAVGSTEWTTDDPPVRSYTGAQSVTDGTKWSVHTRIKIVADK